LILRCYWGYSFESLATENGEDGRGIDANVVFCSVIKTKLGAHRIIMGAEMDCCDATDDGRRFYVELKTRRGYTSYCFHELSSSAAVFMLLIYYLRTWCATAGVPYSGTI
jgi:hypothetical protein